MYNITERPRGSCALQTPLLEIIRELRSEQQKIANHEQATRYTRLPCAPLPSVSYQNFVHIVHQRFLEAHINASNRDPKRACLVSFPGSQVDRSRIA